MRKYPFKYTPNNSLLSFYKQVDDDFAIYKCKCGGKKIIKMVKARSGLTKSCGCLSGLSDTRKLLVTLDYKGRKYSIKNMVGERSGRLLVVNYAGRDKRGNPFWECKCDCGNTSNVRTNAITSKRIVSCGCLAIEKKLQNRDHPLYHIWQSAKDRCYNSKCPAYKRYGARGIKMYKGWINNFDSFYNYCIPLYVSGYKIDRINNDGNYEPGNIRWATDRQSVHNRGATILNKEKVIEIRKSILSAEELSKIYKVSKYTINSLRSKNCKSWKDAW